MGHEMPRPSKNARAHNRWPETTGTSESSDPRTAAAISSRQDGPPPAGAGVESRSRRIFPALKEVSTPLQGNVLSVRAENVLKELAAELTGEIPPAGRWTPSRSLLRKLSFKDLQTARNCGPQTADEIVGWASSQGVVIERPLHAGKSLSAIWRDIIARASAGECTREEITEALERSRRRKNTRIPVALQTILVTLLNATGK